MTVQEKQMVPPIAIMQVFHSYWAAKIVEAAVDLDVFSAIKSGAQTPAQMAERLKLDERGVHAVCDALAGMQLLRKEGDRYALNETSELYLVPSSRLYMGDYLRTLKEVARRWDGLPDSLRTGQPVTQVNTEEEAQKFFPGLAAAIFPMNYAVAKAVAAHLSVDKLSAGSRILDVAAGSGVWSIAAAEENPKVSVDALDFPAVLEVTKQFAERGGVATQYQYIAGDWEKQTLTDGSYDVIYLGHILHSEGLERSRELLNRCFRWLKKGGKLVIAEFMPNEERTGPAQALMFAVNMYLVTTRGCVFTPNELKDLCKRAGFPDCYRMEFGRSPDDSPVMVATK